MAEAFDPDKYLAEKTQAPQVVANQAPAFNPDQYLAEKTGANSPGDPYGFHRIASNPTMQDKSDALRGAGQLLDYPGGLVRTSLAAVGGALTGKKIANDQDMTNALKGQAPSTSEYLKRADVPEGPSLNLPVVGKVSARDAAGFVGDVATDPLTSISKTSKALTPVGDMAESVGKNIYKSGLKKVDERIAEKGAGSLSDLLLEAGKTGTTKDLQEATSKIGKEALDQRTALYDKAKQLGAKVDLDKALESSTQAVADMKSDPGLAPAAEKMEELLNRYKAAGPQDLATASDWKSNLYNALPDTAYDAHGKLKGPAAKVQKALASDFKNAIVDSANGAEAGLGDSIDGLNQKMQTTITAKKPLAMQVRRAETPNLLTSVDAMLAGSGLLHSPQAAGGMLAAKKAADLAKTTYVRTKVGKGLIDAGKSGLLDAGARRGLINSQRPGLVGGDQ